MKVRIRVTLKNGVLDPQGKAIEAALLGLGFGGLADVRQGRLIEMDIEGKSEDEVRAKADEMCTKLLANPVMERYEIELLPA